MEFNEKLQELRKSRSLTQEELAEALFVSRTAISKWESGRGYPSLDSLKEISRFFSVSIDDLICSEEIISAAEDEKKDCMDKYIFLICDTLDIFWHYCYSCLYSETEQIIRLRYHFMRSRA